LAALVAIALVGAISGCDDRSRDQARTPDPPASNEFGRFVVVPATTVPNLIDGIHYLNAWRLDTKTGDLELCTYYPGGALGPNAKADFESLSCTQPNTGPLIP
jgi:hypothetical protein